MIAREYSNNDYKKLGDRIRSNVNNIAEADYKMLQHLRVSYKDPLSTIFNSIEMLAHKVDRNCVCTYRIKRIESIISKLIRFPEMQVNRAEDIAGCRCILSTDTQVYVLYNRIIKGLDKLPFEIKGKINDYIAQPKESGYKSIHINVVLKNDNRRVEIQLRSLEQHNWATLVETTDLLYGSKLKENGIKGNKELFLFHLLLSKTSDSVSIKEINSIVDTIIKYNYIQKLGSIFTQNYLGVRKYWNSLKLQKKHFFLISTGQDGIPQIEGFSCFDAAEAKYFDMFINNDSNKNIVLTHLHNTNFAKISAAYSNYFLTFNNTIVRILFYLSKAVERSFKTNKIISFSKYYQTFLDIMLFWIDKQIVEIDSFQKDLNIKKSKNMHADWGNTIVHGIRVYNEMFRRTQLQLKFRVWNSATYFIMRIKHRNFLVSANEKIASIKNN